MLCYVTAIIIFLTWAVGNPPFKVAHSARQLSSGGRGRRGPTPTPPAKGRFFLKFFPPVSGGGEDSKSGFDSWPPDLPSSDLLSFRLLPSTFCLRDLRDLRPSTAFHHSTPGGGHPVWTLIRGHKSKPGGEPPVVTTLTLSHPTGLPSALEDPGSPGLALFISLFACFF